MEPSNTQTFKHFNGDEMSQECKDMLSTLPSEKGWLEIPFYKYQGFWHHSLQLEGVVSFQKHFKSKPNDTILVSVPKSGTTWLKALLFSLLNRTIFPPTSQNHPLLKTSPHALVPFLEFDLDFHGKDHHLEFESSRIFATHLPYISLQPYIHDSSCKIIYLCRNPKDTLVSLWHFTNKLVPLEISKRDSLDEAFEKFCNGVSVYGPFWDHVLGYWEESVKSPENVLFLKYEEMMEQPRVHLGRIADFLGCSFSSNEDLLQEEILRLCSFGSLSNLEVNQIGKLPNGIESKVMFRRGVVGDWKNHLTVEMAQRLDNITKEKLRGSGLKF